MISRLKPALDEQELRAALSCAGADDVGAFESDFAHAVGQKHAVAFPYGRTAILLTLEAMGLARAQVICPAYTCVVVAHAILRAGAEPVFVDCADTGFNMDLELAEQAVRSGARAIVATSLFGYPVDLDRLEAIRRQHPDLRVIQDCCHSFTCEWKGRPVHRAGDAAVFSFNISKLMTSIFGAMATTDDDALAARLRQLRADRLSPAGAVKGFKRLLYLCAIYPAFSEILYGAVNALERAGYLGRLVSYYDESVVDMPDDHLVAMAPVEARVGRVQLAKYPEIVARRRRLAEAYRDLLDGAPRLVLPPLVQGATYSHYVARVSNRARVVEAMRRRGIQLGTLIDYSIPEMSAYRASKRLGGIRAGQLKAETINLPIHWGVGDEAQRRIARELREVLDRVAD